jgi:hypothetical protein
MRRDDFPKSLSANAAELLREAAKWDLRWTEAESLVRAKLDEIRRALRLVSS